MTEITDFLAYKTETIPEEKMEELSTLVAALASAKLDEVIRRNIKGFPLLRLRALNTEARRCVSASDYQGAMKKLREMYAIVNF